MKTLLIWLAIMMQCLPCYAGGVLMMGGGVTAAAPVCSSGTTSQSQTTGTEAGAMTGSAETMGQSFQLPSSGSLYSISINVGTVTTGATLRMRVGETSDLSSTYLDQVSVAVSSAGVIEFVLPNHPTLESGTTYYFGVAYSGGAGSMNFIRSTTNTYANGQKYYSSTTAFVMDGPLATQDSYFDIKVCD